MKDKILQFPQAKPTEPRREPLAEIEAPEVTLPTEYRLTRVLNAVKYYIIVDFAPAKARKLLSHCVKTSNLSSLILLPPELANLVEKSDLRETISEELRGG